MWMPFHQMSKLTPRQRMAATLNGVVGTGGPAVEVRGQSGHFTQLIQNALDAPRVGSVITGGAYHAAGGRVGFGPNAVKSLFTPAIRARERNSSIQPGPDVVRSGVAGFASGVLPTSLTSRLVRGDAPLPAPETSRAQLPDAAPPPKYEGGSGVVDTSAETAGSTAAQTEATPIVTTKVDPATAPPVQSIPLWQLGLAGAALFGVVWYITRKD